jgi:hypothetical protein
MAIRDTNLDLSPAASDLPLIATSVMSASTLDLEGTPLTGLALRVDYGFTPGNTAVLTPALNVIVHAASSTPVSSSDPIAGYLAEPIIPGDVAAATRGQAIIPFSTNKRYVRAEFAVTGVASDSPAWSAVEAFVVENVGVVWDRNINFH